MLRFNAVPAPVSSLLRRLDGESAMTGFALGGGTSLALRFGHRLSVDLDYFTTFSFEPQDLFDVLKLEAASVTALARNSLTMDVAGVKMDLLRHGYPILEPAEQMDGVVLMSLPDVMAMKLNAIANRGSKKDFFDFVELLEHASIAKMLDCFTAKYSASDPFTVIRSLAWFEDAESEPDPISLKQISWDQVKRTVVGAVARL